LPRTWSADIFAAAMRVLLANHSSYPGTPNAGELKRVLDEQVAAGLDLVTDGQLGWQDAVAPLMTRLDGVRRGAPTVLPGLPHAVRRPIVQAKLRRRRSLCVDTYREARALTRASLKAVLTGPYTLAHSAALATTAYRGADDLAEDLSAVLAQEIAALVAAGAVAIQVDEPLILARPDDVRRLRQLLEPLYDAAGGRATVIVATYGADAGALYAQLNSLPGDVIAVDCAGRHATCDAIAETGAGKPLALGIVDGAQAAPEDAHALHRLVERLLRRYSHATVHLQPACGLGRLPPQAARHKIALLATARAALGTS
jgi:methionine synthase II (cobalamin-independent)